MPNSTNSPEYLQSLTNSPKELPFLTPISFVNFFQWFWCFYFLNGAMPVLTLYRVIRDAFMGLCHLLNLPLIRLTRDVLDRTFLVKTLVRAFELFSDVHSVLRSLEWKYFTRSLTICMSNFYRPCVPIAVFRGVSIAGKFRLVQQ